MRRHILVLLMPHELEVTLETVGGLLRDMKSTDCLSLLMNGGRSEELSALAKAYPQIRYYESERNLGVAGGRNLLLNQCSNDSADLFFVIDNDVVVPRGYLDGLTEFYLKTPNTGVAGALVLDYKRLNLSIQKRFPKSQGVLGRDFIEVGNEELLRYAQALETSELAIYHAGTHPDWYRSYLSVFDLRAKLDFLLKREFSPPFKAHLADDPAFIQSLWAFGITELCVSNVIGCSQVFSREVLQQVGPLRDCFNPYGFEDVDFCIRALKKGFVNRVSLEVVLLHGTDLRHVERNALARVRNISRCLTLLSYLHDPDNHRRLAEDRLRQHFLFRKLMSNPHAEEMCVSELLGLRDAMRQIEAMKLSEPTYSLHEKTR